MRLLLTSPYPDRGVGQVTVSGWLLVVGMNHSLCGGVFKLLEDFLKGLEVGFSVHILVILVEMLLLALWQRRLKGIMIGPAVNCFFLTHSLRRFLRRYY